MQIPMKNKNAALWVASGILTICLLILGLIVAWGPTFSLPTGLQDSVKDTEVYVAATISKETLLLLLAAGVAGVLGLSRKRKSTQKDTQQSDPADQSDP